MTNAELGQIRNNGGRVPESEGPIELQTVSCQRNLDGVIHALDIINVDFVGALVSGGTHSDQRSDAPPTSVGGYHR